jgi:hypothetical protein
MSSAIGSLTSSYLESILSSAAQSVGLTKKQSRSALSSIDASSSTTKSDSGQLSSFTQLMSTLQQLQQSDSTKYQRVTQQIATNLQSAAQTAQSEGNTTVADQLNQLANDFTNASSSDQLPNVQDLAKAVGGHFHHHCHSASTDSGSNSSDSGNSSSSTSDAVSQLLSAFQTNQTQSDALSPMSIILNTLSNAGISSSSI